MDKPVFTKVTGQFYLGIEAGEHPARVLLNEYEAPGWLRADFSRHLFPVHTLTLGEEVEVYQPEPELRLKKTEDAKN